MGQPFITDCEYSLITGRMLADSVRVSVSSGASAASAALARGYYRVSCSVEVFVKQGTTGVVADATTSQRLLANTYVYMAVDGSASVVDNVLAGRTASGSGTLYIDRLG